MKRKIVGTPADRDYRIPVCRVHTDTKATRNDAGEWVCVKCFDEYLDTQVQKRHLSTGGVELPAGVRDPRKEGISYTDLHPNRRWRRAAGRRST